MRFVRRFVQAAAWLAIGATSGAALAGGKDLVVIPQSAQPVLVHKDIPVIFKASGFFLAEWDETAQLEALASDIPFEIIRRDVVDSDMFFLFELHPGEEPPPAWNPLWRSGLNVIVEMNDEQALRWTQRGQHAVRLFHTAHGWGSAAQSFVAYDCAPKPLITGLLAKTSQAQWVDWIEKISGVEPVDIGGTSYTSATRYTSSLFSGAANAKGFDFLKQQAQAWNFSGARLEEDFFTIGPGGKNLVLTIPGQTASEVLLTAHFDSIWQSGSSTTTAPGANDNGTGAATLFEAARLLRQYRFQRTVKIIFFTGEEQGLYGSAAYTQDHAMGNIAGVLNLDMFGYDANGDRCFEIHAGTLPASIDVANCFSTSIASYGTSLTRDFLMGTATNRSDHASFWNVGVGAIEIAENFFNDGQPGGCVGTEPNPGYHTNGDLLASNMHPSYAFSIAQTALATIAAMAVPVEACFAAAPSITATGGTNQVDVSWPAVPGASTYRVLRATNGCGGNFVAVGTTAGTSFVDPLVAPGTYTYKIEAVHADGVCVSPESNCSSATPTVYHATPTTPAITDVCASGGPGNGNGVVEPGETITMAVTLRNDSDTSLSSISGSLSSASTGVTVLDGAASWPDLGPFAQSATLPDHFTYALAPSVVCGAKPSLLVQASALQGAWSKSFLQLVGAPGQSNGSFPSPDVPKPIFDLATAVSNNVVTGPGNVVDINVRVTLTHTWNSDVDIYLRHPDTTLVELSTDNGSDGDNYTNTLFDDEAATSITGGVSPFTGTYRPEGLLSFLDGKPAAGTWKLEIVDDTGQDTGTLQSWTLELTTTAAAICNPCAAAPASPGEAGTTAPLLLAKNGADLEMSWGAPGCAPPTYGVFVGDLSALRSSGTYGHDTALACSLPGNAFLLPIDDVSIEAAYVLAVAATATEEGSYGRTSASVERPASAGSCRPAQNLTSCP